MIAAAALLDEILAHPDRPDYTLARDNQLRLAYAATIEPEERARAELIALQIEVEAAGDSASGRRVARVRELLANHGRGWSAVKDLVDGYRFHRGFVGQVTLSARELLDRGERLYALEPITELALRGGVRELLDAVLASPLLARVRSLDLTGQGLGDVGVARLAASPHLGNLVAINLQANRIGFSGLRALAASAGMPRLRLANLSGNLDDVTPIGDAGELPPLAQQLEEEQSTRIAWLHSGGAWADGEEEALALAERKSLL